jgi:TIR domain
MGKLKIFISWSGRRSQQVAQALHDWLPNVLQDVKPWLSTSDIQKGEKWGQALTGELQESNFGLICLTPENLTSPWLLFEAGALAKKEKSRVWTYLFEVQYEDVIDPLSQFQHTLATEDDTKKLVGTINNALADSLEADRVARQFDKWWRELHDKLERIRESPAPEVHGRSTPEKIDEILTRVRALESVLVTREISDVSDNLKGLRSELSASLAELQKRADSLSEAGERGVEYWVARARIAEAKDKLLAVEARINRVRPAATESDK